MSIVYLFFYRAMKAQGFDRDRLPYKGWFQPYGAWLGLVSMTLIVCCYGYAVFLPGNFDVGTFFIYYLMIFVLILTYSGWKILKRTKIIPASEVDLIWEALKIDEYEATLEDDDGRNIWQISRSKLRSMKTNHAA